MIQTYSTLQVTGKKVCLQIRIDNKIFDMFTSRNVKKIFKYPLSRPTTMSDQIVGHGECWLSNLLDISLEWVGHFGRNMSDLPWLNALKFVLNDFKHNTQVKSYSTLQVYQQSYSQVGHIPPKMSDSLQDIAYFPFGIGSHCRYKFAIK
jgi:hypothetical protein